MFEGVIEKIVSFDRALFYLINVKLQNSFFNVLMPFITDQNNFMILFLVVSLLLIILGRRKEKMFLLLVFVTLLIGGHVSSQLLKPFFARIRPPHVLTGIRLLVNNTESYSFPSTHSTNIFALATLISFKYKKLLIPSILIAFLVAYSRIYVGVHYPLDIVAGVIFGFVCALGVLSLERVSLRAYERKFKKKLYEE